MLAARLSEDPAVSVLLLEAGPDYRSADTPAAFRTRNVDLSVEHNPEFFWTGLTARRHPAREPQYYARGRGVGGSSTVNYLCAIRGVPADYDRWVEQGAPGWGFADVQPAFVRLEDEHDFPDAEYHGRGGPIPAWRVPQASWGAVDHAFCEAVLDNGLPWAEDHNAPGATGLSPFALNLRRDRRVSTNDGYLEPARDRPNLRIRGSSHVDQVIFAPTSRRVVGVRLSDGERCLVRAGGEVILCAGAVHSPAILMRSGIGPAGDLARLGIHAPVDLPVGIGLQDHPELAVEVPTRADIRRGVGSVTNCVLRWSSGLAGAGPNDLMLLPHNGTEPGRSHLFVQLEHVCSRGRLRLCSPDPTVDPLIDLDLLTDERDVVRMTAALERVRELLAHRAFAGLMTGRAELPAPGDYGRVVSDTAHLCSTCRMGGPDETTTVVDPHCRVLGVDGLRVIDASIIPEIPRANLNLTVIMIGEHMAARLKGGAGSG